MLSIFLILKRGVFELIGIYVDPANKEANIHT